MLTKKYFIFLLLLILTGCSSIQQSHTPVEYQAHQKKLDSIQNYSITGKLGYISPKERRSLNLYLQKYQDKTQLILTTFMGQTALKMTMSPKFATIETYDNQHIITVTPQKTLYQLTGLLIPVDQLEHWLLGQPGQADDYTLNDTHTLASVEKSVQNFDWTVNYQSYQSVDYQNAALPLPYKLSLKHDDTKINLIISQWKIKP